MLVFSGVPDGEYELEVRWLGVLVYSKKIKVSEPTKIDVNTRVYDISIVFLDKSGERVYADYIFRDPAGREFRGEFKDGFEAEKIPDGLCSITIIDHDTGGTLYKSDVQAYKLAESGEITLPIGDMAFKVSWIDGKPLENARIVIIDVETGERFEEYTGPDGKAVLEKARYSNYKIVVYYPYTSMPVYSSEIGFAGQTITVTLRQAVVNVKVVDALGSPVQGAEVSVYYGETLLGRAYTDPSGRAELTVLEKPSYRVVARHGTYQTVATVEPNKYVEVKLDVAKVLGIDISLGELSTLIYPLLVIGLVVVGLVVAVRAVLRFLKRLGE